MPTGYTAELIEKPGVTFEAFALRCARAFGALIMMRDDPLDAVIPDDFKPDAYYRESLERSEAKVRELEMLTFPQAEERAVAEYERRLAQHVEWQGRVARENAIFSAMIAKVEAWTPPTPDHEGMKTFMLDQLRMSLNDPPDSRWAPKKMTGDEWLAEERKQAADRLARDRADWDKEVKRAAERTAWVKALRTSLLPSEVKS